MYVEVDENGNFIYKLSDANNQNVIKRTGTIDNWNGGYIGLLTFDSEAKFSNIKYTTTSSKNFETDLTGIEENNYWKIGDIGITGISDEGAD
ncbi:MAG: hypothetical protein V8R64_10625 [Thomasclavelia sp.]